MHVYTHVLHTHPGWNTVGTFIYHIPTGWIGQPTVVLVSLARTFALPYFVNTEFRLVYNQNVSGGSIGMSGASDPAKMGGVHFHDVLPLPSWSRLRIRFEASCRTVHHMASHNRTQIALSGGDYAKLSYPADDLGLQFRRFTLLQVPAEPLPSIMGKKKCRHYPWPRRLGPPAEDHAPSQQ